MSVIFGRIHFHDQPITKKVCENMTLAASWWNPNRINTLNSDAAFIGHCLLFNTPESIHEAQPINDRHSEIILASDARIDNREELAEKLRIKSLYQMPDAELILNAYKHYGKDCIYHLEGAFAFAIWDSRTKEVFCARDHMGVRPFYYYFKEKIFIFGTIKRPILSDKSLDLRIRKDYLINQIGFRQQELSDTVYTHIQKLLPAHTLVVNIDGIKSTKYWDLDVEREITFKKGSDYVEAFESHLSRAVSVRLRSYQNVGAELSGGLDSSGITAYAHRALQKVGKDLTTFSYILAQEHVGNVFPYDGVYAEDNEAGLIDELCEQLGIERKVFVTSYGKRAFISFIDQGLNTMDGLDDYAGKAGLIQSQASDHQVSTLLSGFPGDELVTSFCYNHHLEHLQKNNWAKYYRAVNFSGSVKNKALKAIYPFLYQITKYSKRNKAYISRFIHKQQYGKEVRRKNMEKCFFTKEFLKKHPEISTYLSELDDPYVPMTLRESQRDRIMRAHTSCRMESENINGLQYGVENRYPLSDIRLMQFVLSIPVEQKKSKNQARWLFRRAMKGVIPDSIVDRNNKNGSTMPFGHLEFVKNFDKRMAFVEAAKQRNKPSYIDYDKLITKMYATLNLSKRSGDKSYAAPRRQKLILYLIRYLQLHPEMEKELSFE